jgi:hypothetical protein
MFIATTTPHSGGGQDGEPGGLGPPRFGHQLQTSVVPN